MTAGFGGSLSDTGSLHTCVGAAGSWEVTSFPHAISSFHIFFWIFGGSETLNRAPESRRQDRMGLFSVTSVKRMFPSNNLDLAICQFLNRVYLILSGASSPHAGCVVGRITEIRFFIFFIKMSGLMVGVQDKAFCPD